MLRIDADQLVCDKMDGFDRRFPRQWEYNGNTALPKDVNLPASKLGITRANGEEGLYWIVRQCTNLRINPVASYLR